MSATPCNRCGKLIILAKDRATDKWIALTNQVFAWKPIGRKEGVQYVILEPKLLASHYCDTNQPAASMPEAELHFSEPRDAA